jgi:hypothetical protein
MGRVDVQRAFHSMTLPPPKTGEPHEWRTATPVENGAEATVPMRSNRDETQTGACPDLESLSEAEKDVHAREAVLWLADTLRKGPQPLRVVLALLESSLDLDHCCAERLFWHAHERGYVSLSGGEVYLGRLPATH